jgi:hypothetical protein
VTLNLFLIDLIVVLLYSWTWSYKILSSWIQFSCCHTILDMREWVSSRGLIIILDHQVIVWIRLVLISKSWFIRLSLFPLSNIFIFFLILNLIWTFDHLLFIFLQLYLRFLLLLSHLINSCSRCISGSPSISWSTRLFHKRWLIYVRLLALSERVFFVWGLLLLFSTRTFLFVCAFLFFWIIWLRSWFRLFLLYLTWSHNHICALNFAHIY